MLAAVAAACCSPAAQDEEAMTPLMYAVLSDRQETAVALVHPSSPSPPPPALHTVPCDADFFVVLAGCATRSDAKIPCVFALVVTARETKLQFVSKVTRVSDVVWGGGHNAQVALGASLGVTNADGESIADMCGEDTGFYQVLHGARSVGLGGGKLPRARLRAWPNSRALWEGERECAR